MRNIINDFNEKLVTESSLNRITKHLTEHNCGTKFFNGNVIKSEIGRLVIFPSYFTHTHRGEKCPDGKVRYILSGYFNFKEKNE